MKNKIFVINSSIKITIYNNYFNNYLLRLLILKIYLSVLKLYINQLNRLLFFITFSILMTIIN